MSELLCESPALPPDRIVGNLPSLPLRLNELKARAGLSWTAIHKRAPAAMVLKGADQLAFDSYSTGSFVGVVRARGEGSLIRISASTSHGASRCCAQHIEKP